MTGSSGMEVRWGNCKTFRLKVESIITCTCTRILNTHYSTNGPLKTSCMALTPSTFLPEAKTRHDPQPRDPSIKRSRCLREVWLPVEDCTGPLRAQGCLAPLRVLSAMSKQLWVRTECLERTATETVLAAASPALPEREHRGGQRHGEGNNGNDGFDRHLHRTVVS
jgi:hypothetical protein